MKLLTRCEIEMPVAQQRILSGYVFAYSLVISILFSQLLNFTWAQEPGAEKNKLNIGMLLTLSGKYASAGEDCRQGINAALAVTDGASLLNLVYADSMNDPTTSVSEFRKLVTADKVLAVYTHRSSMGMALNPISASTGVPLLGAVAHEEFPARNKYAFQVAWRTDIEGRFVAQEFIKRKFKRAAMIFTEDEYTSAVAKSFREKLSELGGSIVSEHALNPSEADFRTLLLQVKSKSPDAIYLNLLLPQIAGVIRQAHDLEIQSRLFGNFYAAKEEVRVALREGEMDGVEFVDIDNDLPALQSHLTGGRAVSPPALTVVSYVTTTMLVQAARANPKIQSSSDLYSTLLGLKEIKTPDRVFQITDRVLDFPLVTKTFRHGEIVEE